MSDGLDKNTLGNIIPQEARQESRVDRTSVLSVKNKLRDELGFSPGASDEWRDGVAKTLSESNRRKMTAKKHIDRVLAQRSEAG